MKFGTLQVYPRRGLLQEHGLDLPSSVIGRGEGANILIDDFSVARRHARLTVDSGRLLVEDLGSVAGTFVNGERLEPGDRHLVEPNAELRFGEIEARYLAPPEAEPQRVAIEEPEDAELAETAGLSAVLISPTQPIEAGRAGTATIVVTNRGHVVDNVRIDIPELPDDWYTVENPAFPILPGDHEQVSISIHPPRRHVALSGEYEFRAVVHTQEYGEDADAEGRFEVLPFDSAEISLAAIRSKRKFRLVAENHGNAVARYELFGVDDEQVFRYDFETPAVELQPGERRVVGLSVRRPRKLFGPAQQAPFEIIGKSADGVEISTRGQLAIRPPLQKFKMPVMFALVALLLAATAIGVLILTDGNGTKTASAEDPYAGVHLCEDTNAKADQDKKNAEAATDKPLESADVAGTIDPGKVVFGQVDSTGAPFFAQNDPRWGGQEYAKSLELPNGKDWCGTTIEQCGCAMTSVSVMLALYNIVETPDGQPLTPKTLNDWFNGNATKTDRGFVSRGYIYGDVIWTAANELSGDVAKTNPNATTVRFAGTGDGSDEDIRGQLKLGRPVIVEVPGHWIAAVGIDADTDQILINDPFYRDRKTLDVYKGKVRSSVHYEPSKDLSSVVITAPADVRFRVTDKQGRVVNTGDGTIEQPADVINQIPGASVASRSAWRDPTCIEKAPPAGTGTNQIVLPGSPDDYTIEILGTGGNAGSVAIHSYGKDGSGSVATIEGLEGTKAEVAYDPNADKPVINVSKNGTPEATVTPSNGGGGAGGDNETPTPEPTLPPASPTATPFVEQRTAMTLPAEPGQTRVEVATNSGFELGDPIRFAPGLPNEEDNVIVGFGSFILATPLKYAHSPGEPIQRLPRPPGQGPGLPPGVTPPPDTGPIQPPDQVTMACSTLYQGSPKLATLICDLQVVGDYTTTRWTLNGQVVSEFSGAPSMIVTFPGDSPANVAATVCNQTLCRSTSHSEPVEFPPNLGPGTQVGPNANGTGATPTATPPPAGTVTITCGTAFDQNVSPAVANITCEANFAGDFTSVSWSAPGGKPSSASGPSKTFETQLVNEIGAPTTVKITATVCNFGTCRSSEPKTVGVGQTKTIITTDPANSVPQRHSVTFFAVVTGLNGIVPQGGSVQFVADDIPITPSSALLTVGSLSIAQGTIQTGGSAGLTTVGVHTLQAIYSGGINAFGSESVVIDFNVDPPLPDDCDSVDEDDNGDTDETCDFRVPRNLGAGTVASSIVLSSPGGTQDGLPNAIKVGPGAPVTVSGNVGRTTYCPGCIRQVYIGLGRNDTTSTAAMGPTCVYSGGTALVMNDDGSSAGPGSPFAPLVITAPSAPGVYYVRATTTLDYFCIGAAVGPPDRSVGRIVVQASVTPTLEVYAVDPDPIPASPWDNVLTTQVTKAEAGKTLLLVAKVPPGATGSVDFVGFQDANGNPVARVAPVCPPDGIVPSTSFKGSACTPGEARAISPTLLDNFPSLSLTAQFRNDQPLRLMNPAGGFSPPVQVVDYPVYQAGSPSAAYNIKALVAATATVVASPNPGEMGQPFTLTATVVVTTPPTSGPTPTSVGGTVQFMQGTNPIGSPQTIVNADGTVSLTWTPTVCNGAPPGGTCDAANQGYPFDSRDDTNRSLYDDVHAVFAPGTSDLKSATSADIDVDIDPAPSNTTISNVSVTAPNLGDSFDITATVTATGFNPVPGVVTFKAGTTTFGTHTLADSDCTVAGTLHTCTATLTGVTTGGDNDVIDTAGTYILTATFGGSAQLAPSTSADYSLTFSLAPATLTVTLPNSGTITVGTAGNIRAVVSGSPANRLDDSPARLKFFNGATQLADLAVSNLGGNLQGADFSVATLDAGTYSITVQYVGNAYFTGTTSSAQTFTINKVSPAVSMGSITAVAVGSDLTVSASVTCGGSACSGVLATTGASVSFYKDSVAPGNLLGTDSTISAGGSASITVPTGGTGLLNAAGTAYSIVANFSGNTNLNTVTSSAGTVTLTKRNANVAVTSGATAVKGTDITLNATVSASTAPATAVDISCSGCLQFQVNVGTTTPNWQNVGSAVDVATDGTASITRATGTGAPEFPNVQTYSIRAVYAGNAGYNTATSSPTNASVTEPVPTVTVTTADVEFNSSGNAVAVITPPSGEDPSCSSCVEFRVGTSFAAGTFVGSGSVALVLTEYRASINFGTGSTPIANAGDYTMWARYNGKSGVLNAATSGTGANFTVTPDTVSIVVSANSSVTVDNAITLTATLNPNTAPGTIAFFADGAAITGAGSRTVTNGVATFSWTPTAVGTVTISAQYTSTSTNYTSQASSTNDDVIVNPHAVTVTVSRSPSSIALGGGSVTLTATLSPIAAPGTIRFFADGVDVSGAVTADTSDGVTTYSWTPTSVGDGTATITATYVSSDTKYSSQSNSNSVNVTINAAVTTLTATGDQPGGAGTPVTLSASITSGFLTQSDIDGGTVTWVIKTAGGAVAACTRPGSAPLTASVVNGTASLTDVTCPVANNYNVTGSYSGAGNYAGDADTTDDDLDVT
ncbi:MAG: Ig-like domain repeat protein [Dehalococcoidia bacterium]